MPGRDGTGPAGAGPGTGRRSGNAGFGRGAGSGRGVGTGSNSAGWLPLVLGLGQLLFQRLKRRAEKKQQELNLKKQK